MKEIKNKPVDINIQTEDIVNPDKFYGVKVGNMRGFITRPAYETGGYVARCLPELTKGNGWSYTSMSLASLITLLQKDKYKVFEFDSPVELMKWLSETSELY